MRRRNRETKEQQDDTDDPVGMSPGLSYSMPLLLINLGGEMLYILEQRLSAQKISKEKASRVLCDVVRTMFSKRFVRELFKAQWIYSDSSIRQIFDKLAHSSIMKLNETSMSKLYSLMVMGVKYQLVRCTQPSRLLQVTEQHIRELRAMCGSKATDELMDDCARLCESRYGKFTVGDWLLCKQQLAQFFQGRKVRVSLFLQQQIQATDGTLSLDAGGALPEGAEPPGLLRTFSLNGQAQSVTRLDHPLSVPDGPDDHGKALATKLGANMYTKQQQQPMPASEAASESESKDDPPAPLRKKESTTSAELSLLAELVGGCDDDKCETFKLELFDGDSRAGFDSSSQVIRIDGNAQRKTAAERMRDLGLEEKAEAKTADTKVDDDDDDLLALMDYAK